MAIAVADKSVFAYVAEVTAGTTPANPAFQYFPVTSCDLQPTLDRVQSQQIVANGDIADLVDVGIAGQGTVGFEMQDTVWETFLESVLRSTWSTNTIKNALTQKAFTIEQKDETGGTDSYTRLIGGEVGTMSLNFAIQQIVTGQFTLIGRQFAYATTAISGSTYTADPGERVFDPVSDISSVTVTGLTAPALAGLTLNLNSNPRPQRQLGSRTLAGIATGRLEVTGTVQFYMDSAHVSALNDAVNNTESDFEVTIGSVTGKKYTITIPRLKWGSPTKAAQGINTDVVVNLPFTGLRDAGGIDATIEIDRNVS